MRDLTQQEISMISGGVFTCEEGRHKCVLGAVAVGMVLGVTIGMLSMPTEPLIVLTCGMALSMGLIWTCLIAEMDPKEIDFNPTFSWT